MDLASVNELMVGRNSLSPVVLNRWLQNPNSLQISIFGELWLATVLFRRRSRFKVNDHIQSLLFVYGWFSYMKNPELGSFVFITSCFVFGNTVQDFPSLPPTSHFSICGLWVAPILFALCSFFAFLFFLFSMHGFLVVPPSAPCSNLHHFIETLCVNPASVAAALKALVLTAWYFSGVIQFVCKKTMIWSLDAQNVNVKCLFEEANSFCNCINAWCTNRVKN